MADVVDEILAEQPPWYSDATPEKEVGRLIFDIAQEIEQDQYIMREGWRQYARSYSNREELGLDWNLDASRENLHRGFVTENVVKSVIDTAASIIAKNRVKVRVLTTGADFTDQRKAQRLEKFVYGEMRARKCWELGPLIFRDACIFGTGVLKVFGKKSRTQIERRLISDIIVDERSAIDGHPKELFERQLVDVEVLVSRYPKHKEAILNASENSSWAGRDIPSGSVVVVEGWRLGPKGRHVIAIEGTTLFSEKYTKKTFPFVFFRWDGIPISGFYGLGLARDLHGIQQRINQLNRFIRRCQDLISVPRVFVDMSSKTLKVQVNNKIGAIIPYRGKPPQFMTAQAVGAEIYQYKEQLKASAFEFAGISQMSAQSLKPAGLESAVALREFSDIETSRFVIQSQRYETFYTELGSKVIETARELYANKSNMRVRFPNANVLELIDWSDVNLDEDRFDLDIQPASLLSMSPSARLQAVTELAQVGQLDRAEVRYLLNHPDLPASTDLATADLRMAMKIEEELLDGKKPIPEPFYNHDLMIRRLQLLYQSIQCEYDNVPEKILNNISTFVSQSKSQLEQAASAGVAAGPVDPAAAAGGEPLAGGPTQLADVNLPGQL